MMETLPNFTPRVQQALTVAKELAQASFTEKISLDHLFLGMLGLQTNFLGDFFHRHKLSVESFSSLLTESLAEHLNDTLKSTKPSDPPKVDVSFDSSVKSVLAIASLAAEKLKHEYVGLEHLLLGLLKHKKSPLLRYLKSIDKNPDDLVYDLKSLFREEGSETFNVDKEWRRAHRPQYSAPDALETYTVNFNQLAADGKLDAVIGQERELGDLAEILCRRKKNNPILLGSAGVGKTALVEGLAQQIVKGECADFLIPKVIYGLDLASLIAGTKYRGQFEERLQKIISQFKNNEHAIVFVDELHTLVGAGSAEGTLDAANILKPALARGELTCIGATTFKEYKKNIEKDAALARRFQPITIEEPDEEETLKILEGIKYKYEDFHGVKYKPSALKLIVSLATRFLPERHMPDKAIDILDQSASRRKIEAFKRPDEARAIEQKLTKSFDQDHCSKAEEKLFERYKELLDEWAEDISAYVPRVTEGDIVAVVASKTGAGFSILAASKVPSALPAPTKV